MHILMKNKLYLCTQTIVSSILPEFRITQEKFQLALNKKGNLEKKSNTYSALSIIERSLLEFTNIRHLFRMTGSQIQYINISYTGCPMAK